MTAAELELDRRRQVAHVEIQLRRDALAATVDCWLVQHDGWFTAHEIASELQQPVDEVGVACRVLLDRRRVQGASVALRGDAPYPTLVRRYRAVGAIRRPR